MLTIDVAAEPKNVTPMTEDEARASIQRVEDGITSVRAELLELHRRQGYKALGYSDWKEFAEKEFKQNRRNLYYMVEAAEVEAELVSSGIDSRKIFHTPESQLRAIAKAPVTRQAAAFEQLKQWEEEDGKATEREAEAAVAAVDPNYAHQRATQLVTKAVREGADIDPSDVEGIFKDSSPRLKQVLAEPVRELLKQAALNLPPSKPVNPPSSATNSDEDDDEETAETITENEAEEVRVYLYDFSPEEFAIIVAGMPKAYLDAIRERLY